MNAINPHKNFSTLFLPPFYLIQPIEDTAISIAKTMIKVTTAAIIPTIKYKYFIISSVLLFYRIDKIIPTKVPKPIAKTTPIKIIGTFIFFSF